VAKKILVATTNPGKIAELRAMLEFDVEWVGLADFPNINEVREDGETFAENARKKAIGYAKQTGLWTIADDSGLIVDALGGEPGVKSARFAESQRRDRTFVTRASAPVARFNEGRVTSDERRIIDRKNFEKVLKLLKNVPHEKRSARFVCCLCLASPPDERWASPERILAETEGTLKGVIAEEEAGENGFGYDPIFFVPKLNKTVAQLTCEEKNAISHRGNAIRKLKPLLENLLLKM
jgi:XTP/dITP diphosphohydrolase